MDQITLTPPWRFRGFFYQWQDGDIDVQRCLARVLAITFFHLSVCRTRPHMHDDEEDRGLGKAHGEVKY